MAQFIPVPRLCHVALDAEFVKPAVQLKVKVARLVTHPDLVCKPSLFHHGGTLRFAADSDSRKERLKESHPFDLKLLAPVSKRSTHGVDW